MDILTIRDLHKSFGSHNVLNGVSLQVPEHCVFGFIGQNGAGKTTMMKAVLGLLKIDAGEIYVGGEKVHYGDAKTNRFIGYLPDVPEFYSFMSPMEYLYLCGEITGMQKSKIKIKSEELLSLVGLSDSKSKKIHGFSRGMKQRLGIAQALLNEPRLLICDEPTSALDPVGRKEILEILHQVKKHTTVIFSTHILADVERVCDQVAILNEGKIVVRGELDEIRKNHKVDSLLIEFIHEEDVYKFQKDWDNVQQDGTSYIVVLRDRDIYAVQQSVLAYLSKANMPILRFEIIEPSLENLFMEVVK